MNNVKHIELTGWIATERVGQISVVLNIALHILENIYSPVYGPFSPTVSTLAASKQHSLLNPKCRQLCTTALDVTEGNHVLVRAVEKSLVFLKAKD